MSKVYSIVMKVRLDCPACNKKINKALCSICVCEVQSKSFNEKENTVTITGTFDPEKIMKKICRKAGKFILSYEVTELVKKEDKALKKEKAASAEKPDPAPAGDKKKAKNDDNNDKKKGESKKKSPESLTVDFTPEQKPDPAPQQSPAKPAPKSPVPGTIPETATMAAPYLLPAIGTPAGWYYCEPCHNGCQYDACHGVHDRPPCSCGCSCGRQNEGSHYGQQCGFFSEEESTCRVM